VKVSPSGEGRREDGTNECGARGQISSSSRSRNEVLIFMVKYMCGREVKRFKRTKTLTEV
jgi:hypothetical protein